MNNDIYKKVIACAEEACETEFKEISLASRLRDDLQMDSLQLVMFQVNLENEFAFYFDPMEELATIFNTIESVCEYIEKL